MIDYSNEPLLFTPEKPQKLTEQPWFKVNTPTTYWIVGQKRSGKGVAIDKFITGWLKAGITVLYLHSASGYENLYLAVNKNCKQRWEETDIEKEGKLHCNCHRAIPILVAIPDFIEINQQSVDRYNGIYWDSFTEINEAFIHCKIDDRPLRDIDYTKIKKPSNLKKIPINPV